MKKRNDLSALANKVSHKSIVNRFEHADQALGTDFSNKKERVIGKSFTLIKNDLENIKLIKEKCLNKRVVVSDSQVVRLALYLAAQLIEDDLINASLEIPKIQTGRPKGVDKI